MSDSLCSVDVALFRHPMSVGACNPQQQLVVSVFIVVFIVVVVFLACQSSRFFSLISQLSNSSPPPTRERPEWGMLVVLLRKRSRSKLSYCAGAVVSDCPIT